VIFPSGKLLMPRAPAKPAWRSAPTVLAVVIQVMETAAANPPEARTQAVRILRKRQRHPYRSRVLQEENAR